MVVEALSFRKKDENEIFREVNEVNLFSLIINVKQWLILVKQEKR